ncbi:aquaporin AQPAe.a-like [Diprion similis]|uniref:aquaporin AQPAe.a-like n=1 Tax=Diprion similis TaxID=362088 RepID=UPI001EF7ED31|nr:aquaporin AQPAe.a-like [Diprion similis]
MADIDCLGLGELDSSLVYAMLSEFIGCTAICFFGCGSSMKFDPETPFYMFSVALTFGIMYTVCTFMFADMSDAHFNPAITAGLMIINETKVLRGALYIVMHLLGCCLGVLFLLCVTPFDRERKFFYRNYTLGYTAPSKYISATQALLIETLVTFILMMTILLTTRTSNSSVRLFGPFAIGFIFIAGITAFGSNTGGSFNPARSFAPALLARHWHDHWVYWLGPILGSVVAAFLYKCIFKSAIEEGEESEEEDATDKSNDVVAKPGEKESQERKGEEKKL